MARMWGARQLWILACDAALVLDAISCPQGASWFSGPLTGRPLSCADLRSIGASARSEGQPFLVHDTRCGPWGCASVRLGAHVAVYAREQLTMVGVARDADHVLPDIGRQLEELPLASDVKLQDLETMVEEAAAAWHAASDAAQVVASFLRCHPLVSQVRYPGLRGDPSFDIAARTLIGGFGPLIDFRCGEVGEWQRLECRPADPVAQVAELEDALWRGTYCSN